MARGVSSVQFTIFKGLAEGKFDIDIAEVELVQLASAWFSGDHVVCPGLIGCGDIEKRLGYKPGNILFTGVQTVLSAKCKVCHNPSLTSQTRASSGETADPCTLAERLPRMP